MELNNCLDQFHCHFCECNMLIPNNYIDRYIIKNINNTRKLQEICRISNSAYDYLSKNYPQICKIIKKINFSDDIKFDSGVYFRIKLFFHYNKCTEVSAFCSCDVCYKDACMFHFINSYFSFHKCHVCSKITQMCGWCQQINEKNYCLYCDVNSQFMFLD